MTDELKVFGGNSNPKLTKSICEYLEMPQGRAHLGRFPDGEIETKINEDIRGSDVFFVQSTCPPVNDNLMEMLVFIDSAKRASAARICAVIPYFGYARQDRKDEGRVPITAKLVANLLQMAGADRVVAIDMHATQIQGFFDVPLDHLFAFPIFAKHYGKFDLKRLVVASPDVGRIKMARAYASRLSIDLAIVDKRRAGAERTEVANLIGSVKGKDVLIVDDMITTAGTITEAARVVKEKGAKNVFLGATHPVFCNKAIERIDAADVKEVIVTDTIPLGNKKIKTPVTVLSVAPLLGEVVRRIHQNRSVSSLFEH
jgi:ribose-phosphate pyrophosphokinase